MTLIMASNIVLQAFVSFLNFGIKSDQTSWGNAVERPERPGPRQLVVGLLPGHGHRPDGHHQLHRRRARRARSTWPVTRPAIRQTEPTSTTPATWPGASRRQRPTHFKVMDGTVRAVDAWSRSCPARPSASSGRDVARRHRPLDHAALETPPAEVVWGDPSRAGTSFVSEERCATFRA